MAEPPDRHRAAPIAAFRKQLEKTVKLTLLRRFFRTKRAIRQGVPLYDYSPAEISRRKMMGPWELDITESILAGLAGILVTALLGFFLLDSQFPKQDPDPVANVGPATFQQTLRLFQKVQKWATPFFLPTLLMLVSWLLAWASLRSGDTTPERRLRAQLAYLYFDGSYGLAPQAAIVTGIVLFADIGVRVGQDADKAAKLAPLVWIALAAILLGMSWQFYLSVRKIPRKLFVVNGYSDKFPAFTWSFKKYKNLGPIHKYSFMLIFGVGLSAGLLQLVWLAVLFGISYAVVGLRLLISGG